MRNVVLCSEWSRDLYPANTGGKFTNLLHSNLNFSGENWSVALTDIVYTPDTLNNVRADSNDIQIRMKGFLKWGLVPYSLKLLRYHHCIGMVMILLIYQIIH